MAGQSSRHGEVQRPQLGHFRVADRGESDSYSRVRAALDPVAKDINCPIIWVMGNHDDRGAFRRVLLDEKDDSVTLVYRGVDLVGLRLIALDSTVPGYHHGALGDEQLQELTTPLRSMTVLEFHRPERCEELVRGTDIRAILGGHRHYSTAATFAGGARFCCRSGELHDGSGCARAPDSGSRRCAELLAPSRTSRDRDDIGCTGRAGTQ